jgi:hypothetical protein
MPPFLVCRGLSDRDRHFAEMRAALHMGKRLLPAARRRFCQATAIQATAHNADGIRCGLS